MPQVKLRLPKADLPFYLATALPSLSRAAKARLADALAQLDRSPAPNPPPLSQPSEAVTVWLSEDQAAQINALMVAHHIDNESQAASGLLHALALCDEASRAAAEAKVPVPAGAETTLDAINRALGDSTRPDQARFFAGLRGELLAARPAHDVIFAEASTGVGKTRAFLAAAMDWLSAHRGQHVVIAAPSYSVLLQTLAQWRLMAEHGAMPSHEVVVGMQEFVSQHALERVLQEFPDTEGATEARRWMNAGGPVLPDDPFGHAWMLRSLVAATDGRWPLGDEVTLDSDSAEDDLGAKAYQLQFHSGRASDVVFCTHAMLAVDVRLRTSLASAAYSKNHGHSASDAAWKAWLELVKEENKNTHAWELRNDYLRTLAQDDGGRLPPIGLLIVDEAHLLEQNFASVFASAISLSRLVADLRRLREQWPRAVPAQSLQSIGDAFDALREYGRTQSAEPQTVAEHGELHAAVVQIRKALVDIGRKLPRTAMARREARKLRTVTKALDIAARGANERFGMRVQVGWSPNYHWPNLSVGRYDVSREMDFLWSVLVGDKSVLVSGTLYEDVSLIGLENMRRVLSVRQSALRPLPPIRPAWLYEPVTLYEASAGVHVDGLPRFRRPTRRDRLDPNDLAERTERWRHDIAGYVAGAYASAGGGMLVLMTSHAERAELVRRLEQAIPAACLLSQGDGRSLEALRHAFLDLSGHGQRPCLIAVGAAWTGLDLSDNSIPANQDNLLTDLVIPLAPFGTNRTLTHEWRREHAGMLAEIGSTSIMFRQGIGRLVRREGLPQNRRLHILDTRIHDSQWRSLFQPVVRALGRYTRRQSV